jgi:tRNA(Ile)-lysidine synthase
VLRPYCLAILADSEVIFIEDTYSSQKKVANKRHFYLYGNI